MLATLKDVLGAARDGKYAVGAYNIVNPLCMSPLLKAAENERSPLIINVAEVSFDHCDIRRLAPAIIQSAKDATVPVVVNLDHGLSENGILTAIRCGFTSAMFDASKLDYEDNIATTRKYADMVHTQGMSIEGELGHVGGLEAEAGDAQNADADAFTKVELVADFVERSNIDALAVAIGNVHGFYNGDPCLQFELLEQIREVSKVPLVLHGGSGISDEDFKKAAQLGICKINFYTGLSHALHSDLCAFMKELNGKYVDMTTLSDHMMASIQRTAQDRMRCFGSAGKA